MIHTRNTQGLKAGASRHPSAKDRKPASSLLGLCLAAAFGAVLASAPVSAQNDDALDIPRLKADIAKLKRDVQKAEADLRKTDSLTRGEAALAQRNEERAQKDKERREKEIAALQGRMQDLRKQIGLERSNASRAENGKEEIEAKRKNLGQYLAGWCDSLLLRVQSSPPLEREPREERVRALKNDLLAGTASPEEGISRFSAIVKDEIRSGDEVALLNRPLTLKSGETINAQILKVGNQFAVFMDEDGKHSGFLERDGGSWTTREVDGFEEKLAVKKAIEVKGAKQPPQLVQLEVRVEPARAGAAQTQGAK